MGVSGGTMEKPDGGSTNGESTAATLSPKNEPYATTEKVLFTHAWFTNFLLLSGLNFNFSF